MKTCAKLLLGMLLASSVVLQAAHTPEETNAVVRAMLGRVRLFCSVDDLSRNMELWRSLCPGTWEKFLGTADAGWTFDERKGAFDWYLSSLGSSDLKSKTTREQDDVLCAISGCILLKYADSASSLMSLALNTNGVHRDEAARAALSIGPVSDEATSFVEYVTTNRANLAGLQRGLALAEYGRKLRNSQLTNTVERVRAVEMFYRNRKSEIAAAIGCDMVLTNFLSSYSFSSNRLDAALGALEDCELMTVRYRRYFDSVTNQLLSSGQPLQQLSLVEGND